MSSSPRQPSLAMRIIESYREYIVLFVVLPISFVLRILRACNQLIVERGLYSISTRKYSRV